MGLRSVRFIALAALCFSAAFAAAAQDAAGQGIDVENRPVSDIRVEGLRRVDPQLVDNQIRVKKGDPYNSRVVHEDIVRITNLGTFASVKARVEQLDDGSVRLFYVLAEQNLITDVQVVGNRQLSDLKLFGIIRLRAGDPIVNFLIDRARKQIIRAYEEAGYFDTSISVDEKMLDETGILLFRVVEGERLRIRAIHFEGNKSFTDKQLLAQIRSKTYIFILRKGELSRERTAEDAARLRQFYRDRGFLDAQVVREITISPDRRDGVVTFTVIEGEKYIVAGIEVKGNKIFTADSIIDSMTLRVGDVFSVNRKDASRDAIRAKYGELGFIETTVQLTEIYREDDPLKVDVLVEIVQEGRAYFVGTVTVKGNELTKDAVIIRQARGMDPGRPFVGPGLEKTRERLNRSPLFERGTTQVTILGESQEKFRDVLIEVDETNTGSIGFGAGISSDAGVVGAIDLRQRNFDIADPPESVGEFFTGKAFRGAGQYFQIALQPGNEVSRYSMTFREPYLLDSSIFLDTNLFFFQRDRGEHDEERSGGQFGIGQRFGDVWSASIRTRYEFIDISDISADAPVDVFAVEGASEISSLGLNVARSTLDSRIFPTRGSRISMSLDRAGSLGGDYDFTKLVGEHQKFWTVEEDFFGRRTVLSSRIRAGYIFEDDEAPLFERFYAGGHRSFRGFSFRGVGPRGIQADTGEKGDDPVGGRWLFLFSLEYNFPIYQEVLRAVFFTDTGTVDENVKFSEYRVSVGAGLRLRVPMLGDAPFAFDFAIPVVRDQDDDERVFSFDLAIPF